MAGRSAKVTSIEAIRSFRTALVEFMDEVSQAIVNLELESRRPIEWLEHDRARYWPREVRRASDALNEARLNLDRCQLTIDADEHRSCYEERKQFEKAKQRLAFAESKVQAVHQWLHRLKKEVEEFHVQAAKMKECIDADLPRGKAHLERLIDSLDQYVQAFQPGASASSVSASNNSSTSSPEPNVKLNGASTNGPDTNVLNGESL